MNSDRITDTIATVGDKPFSYTGGNKYLLHRDLIDETIEYLSIGQSVSFELSYNNGKENGINIKIEGEYLKTGKIIYIHEDEYLIIKEKNCDKFHGIKYEDNKSLKLRQCVTFKDTDLVKLDEPISIEDIDLLEQLNIMDNSLKIPYLVQNPVHSFIKKKHQYQSQNEQTIINKTGTVTAWKGLYGFINCTELPTNIYVSNKHLPENITELYVGQSIRFELNTRSNKYFATNIEINDKLTSWDITSWDIITNTGTININGKSINIMKQV